MRSREDSINYWKGMLEIKEWDITTKEIDPKSVTYDSDCSTEDRYFVGIETDHQNKKGTIYHDRDITDRDVIHELLHVRYPNASESWVNEMEEILYRLPNRLIKTK